MSSTAPEGGDLSNSPRFVTMTSTIAGHLLEAYNVDDVERAIQLYAVVENGVFHYMNQGTSKLSDEANQAFSAWLNSGKKKLVRQQAVLQPGQVLAERYRIEKLVGQGGMGAVYQARHLKLEQTVAIKEVDSDDSAAFAAEGRILSRLSHPNLPRVWDFFEEAERQYLVMDYIDGMTLERLVERNGPFPESEVKRMALSLCEVLEYLHGQSPPVIFRDLKPSNIMMNGQNQLFLIDFGVAKIFEQSTGRGTQTFARNVGSPGFAAPEQYSETGTDVRTDIYALGATLYNLLTGQVPPPSVSLAAGTASLPPLRSLRPDVSYSTASTVERMLRLRASERPQDVVTVRRALQRTTAAAPSTYSAISQPRQVTQRRLPPPVPAPAPQWHAAPTRHLPKPARQHRLLGTGLLLGMATCVATIMMLQRAIQEPPAVIPPPPPPGALQVESTPKGARVYLDGVPEGTTPWHVDGLAAGSIHEVSITLRGRQSAHRQVLVKTGDNRLSVSLARAPATLDLRTWPEHVQVRLGPKLLGESDSGRLALHLAARHYILRFSAPWYQPVTRLVALSPGHLAHLNVHLQPDGYTDLAVDSEDGASVRLDGQFAGHAPLTIRHVAPGTHRITVVADDGRAQGTVLDVTPGHGPVGVSLPLPPPQTMYPWLR